MPTMSSRRLEALLGPLIVLLLVGGVIAAVLGGGDDETEFAEQPTEFADPFDDEPVDEEGSPVEEPTVADGVEPDATTPAAGEGDDPAGGGGAEIGGTTQTDQPGASPTPEPAPTGDPVGSEVAVEDPTALTGGWEGGTPNTGTAISAGGLLLLAVGAGLLWLRRARA